MSPGHRPSNSDTKGYRYTSTQMETEGGDSLRYAHAVEEAGFGPSLHKIIEWVGTGKRVLDVGCSTGYVAQSLILESHCIVDGIEIDPVAAEQAQRYCRTVYVGSIEDPTLLADLPKHHYDVVLLADVLEHLVDPGKTLRAITDVLGKDGYVLASVPNVAFWDIRKRLFFKGEWKYTETGIMDRTHLRFYTYYSIVDLIESAGYTVVERYDGLAWLPFERTLKRIALSERLMGTQLFISLRNKLIRRYPNLCVLHCALKIRPRINITGNTR